MKEFDLQRFTVQLLEVCAAPHILWFAVPNGELRTKRTGARLKAMGVRAGVADIAMVLPGGIAAFLELKAGKKGRQSAAQVSFQVQAKAAGALYAVAASPEQVMATLARWGAVRRHTLPILLEAAS